MFRLITKCFNYFNQYCKKTPLITYTYDNYKASGVLFTNGTHMLAGYQSNKKTSFISGIGGTRENGETYFETAIRETLEELFEIYIITEKLFQDIKEHLIPKKVIQIKQYINIIFSFSDLQILMDLIKKHNIISELYVSFPSNINDLIFNRKLLDKKVEISHLCILPLVNYSNTSHIDRHFLSDISQVMDININNLQ